MKKFLLMAAGLISACTFAQESGTGNLVLNSGFEQTELVSKMPTGWKLISPRQEIAPAYNNESAIVHSGKGSARLSASAKHGTYGYLTTTVNGIQSAKKDVQQLNTMSDSVFLGEESYLVGGYFRTEGIENPERNIRMKISWLDEKGNDIFTEFVSRKNKDGDWYHISEIKRAPLNSVSISVNLVLQWPESGSVCWDDISVEKAPSAKPVFIKAASAASWPKYPSTKETNLTFYSDLISKAGNLGADIICLGEGITMVSTGKSYAEASETIPGPSTKTLGEAAKKAHAYVIAGLYEREGSVIYNTAVLLDRSGNVVGKYRKTHLPQTEVEGGLTPGNDYPVFQTDFGVIGIEICYDNFFPEVARKLAIRGAQMVFCPIWGDIRGMNSEWNVVARARAIDNSVYFVASMYEKWGGIIVDPNGSIMAESSNSDGLILSKVNLGTRTFEKWLSVRNYGEWKNLFGQERRPETY